MVSPDRIESAEVLRGIAAFSVMWFHLTNGNPAFPPSGSVLRMSGTYGYLGVDLFFVISGFVIPYSMCLRGYQIADGPRFLVRRIVRIEPAYLVSALLIIILQFVSALIPDDHANVPSAEMARALAYHVAYLAPWFGVAWLSPVYWSLAIEFQYYLAMIFFCPLLLSHRRIPLYLFLILTGASSLSIHDIDRTIFPYLPLFGLGFVRFLAYRTILNRLELAAWALIFAGLCWMSLGFPAFVAGVVAFTILFIRLSRPVPILSFLGAISYSLYLLHVSFGGRIINLASRFSPTILIQAAAVAFAVVISIAAAYLFWRLVEKPSADLSKSIAKRAVNAATLAGEPSAPM